MINTLTTMKETIEGYKIRRKKKVKILYTRMDDTMIKQLKMIRDKTGISISEIIREGVRRIIADVDQKGGFTLRIK